MYVKKQYLIRIKSRAYIVLGMLHYCRLYLAFSVNGVTNVKQLHFFFNQHLIT